ncbi:MAG: serine hydrolase [Bacteroidota bacterium]
MNLRIICWLALVVVLCSTCKIDHNYQLKTTFKRVVPDLLDDFDVPGLAVILAEDGKIDYEQYSGYVDPEKGTKWQKSTPLPALNVEESLLAWLLLRQVDQGTLQIEEPIKPFWKVWPIADPKGDSLTLGDLLSHQSGFAQDAQLDSLYFEHAPGQVFKRHPLNLEFAKVLAAQLSDQAYPEFLRTEVLEPMGLDHAKFGGQIPDTWTVEGQRQETPTYEGLILDLQDLKTFLLASLTVDSFLMTPALLDTMHYAWPGTDGAMGLGYQTYLFNIRGRHSGQCSEWKDIHTVVLLDRARQNGMIVASTGKNSDVLIDQLVCKWAKFHGGSCNWDMIKIPLARALEKPYREGGKAAMYKQYQIFKQYYNTSYHFRPFVLQRAGQALLNDSTQLEFARDLLQLNALDYPHDDETTRSLGMAFEMNGQVDSAIVRYEEAYFMNPGHTDIPNRLTALGHELRIPTSYPITFVVQSKAVPEGDTIFIAGNHPELGSWEPGLVPMTKVDDQTWSITFDFYENTKLIYKFTLGEWDSEAMISRRHRMDDEYLKVQQDTTLAYQFNRWVNSSE